MHETPPISDHTGGQPSSRRFRLIRSGSVSRTTLTLVALAGLLGLGATGTVVATLANGEDGSPAQISADNRDRTELAERANRSDRQTAQAASPSALPLATSPSAAATTGRAAAASPSAHRKTPTKARPKPKPKPKPKAWVNPLPGATVTSCYGMRGGVLHAGIDLAQPANTPIHAAGAGIVIAAGWAYTGYGISVVIDHGNGFLTHYAHQNQTIVTVGQKVKAGQIIGYEGSTGDSTGPHLHFEVHAGGLWNQIDPAPWMRARGVNLGC